MIDLNLTIPGQGPLFQNSMFKAMVRWKLHKGCCYRGVTQKITGIVLALKNNSSPRQNATTIKSLYYYLIQEGFIKKSFFVKIKYLLRAVKYDLNCLLNANAKLLQK